MSERRSQPRLREKNQVAVTVLAADGAPELVHRTFFCPTEDVSVGGLRLCVSHNVPLGALLSMRIAFRKPVRSFHHEGRVVWVQVGEFLGHPFALGIQFTKLQEGTTEAWERMMERKISDDVGVAEIRADD